MIKAVVLIFALLSSVMALEIHTKSFSDSFVQIDNHHQKKEEFIKLLLPIVEYQNSKIVKEREFVESFFSNDFFITLDRKMDRAVLAKLTTIAKKYNIKNLFDKNEYLKRIDTIPTSMTIAQAALESGWGGSLYAQSYNNIFGHYTFTKGIKSHRVAGKRERIREFDSIDSAVEKYMININSHWAYEEFREKRAQSRAENREFSGLEAIEHLVMYSEIRNTYIRKLRSVIVRSNLALYDMLDSRLANSAKSTKLSPTIATYSTY